MLDGSGFPGAFQLGPASLCSLTSRQQQKSLSTLEPTTVDTATDPNDKIDSFEKESFALEVKLDWYGNAAYSVSKTHRVVSVHITSSHRNVVQFRIQF